MYLRDIFEEPTSRPRGIHIIYMVFSVVCTLVVVSGLLYVSISWLQFWCSAIFGGHHKIDWSELCKQTSALEPPSEKLGLIDASHFLTEEYKLKSASLLSGAVQIPTESFDDMDPEPLKDTRFKVFKKLHHYLGDKFPLTTGHLETVNTYGLLYTIDGKSNEKPVILMAHQDVVPVDRSTIDQWTHGAFSGHFDGEKIWGRGAADTKSSLIAILESTETLLLQGWVPERTVLISFGFDEELDGSRGALSLADTIRERYGESDSIYMIVDEGSEVSTQQGAVMAMIGVSEKGYTDISINVNTPGGHSSIPPDHTGIGILSEVLTRLEDSHIERHAYRLRDGDLVADTFGCVAKYGVFDNEDEKGLQQSLLNTNDLSDILASSRMMRTLIGTTQAIDVVNGGVKINALPESASAVVNYRIDVHESVSFVTSQVQEVVQDVAQLYRLGVTVNDNVIYGRTDHGQIEIVNGQSIEPASISPYDYDDEPWRLLAGTTKHVLDKWFGYSEVTASPLLLTGNTDTWRYTGLTDHVYRYIVTTPECAANAHTVDEYMTIEGHLASVAWYYELLQFF